MSSQVNRASAYISGNAKVLTKDDFENMKLQFALYDPVYKYCRNRLARNLSLEQSKRAS